MKKKQKKIKNINQASFYFEDYLETNKQKKSLKKKNDLQDRIYLIFFFFSVIDFNIYYKNNTFIFKQVIDV